ncbi:MAG: apolipoprotein N-acyltransferase [bacterium]
MDQWLVDAVPWNSRLSLSLLAGLALALSFPPYHLVFFLPVGFALLPFVLPGQSRWSLVRSTATIGFVFYALHVYWFINFHLAALPMVLLVLSIYFALWGYLLSWTGVSAWTVSGGWMLLQLVTGSGFLAFPWSRVSTALAAQPVLVQPVRWTGELAWGGLVVFLCYSLGQVLRDNRFTWRVFVSAVLVLGLIGAGTYRMQTTELTPFNQDVLLVQPNVMSTFSATNQSGMQLKNLRSLTRREANPGDVVIWPETALMGFPLEFSGHSQLTYRTDADRRRLRHYVENNNYLLTGTRFYDPHPNKLAYLNGAVLLEPDGRPSGLYTKRIMVPFGEYIPGMGQYELIEKFGRLVGTLGYRSGERGGLMRLPPENQPIKTAVQICYEDVFPGYVHSQVRKGADLLVNISNDSWSRSSAAHWQHFYRARLRAIETGRSLLRNGNTGITALINPLGRTTSLLKPFEKGVVRDQPLKPLKKSYIVKWNFWISLTSIILLFGAGFLSSKSESLQSNFPPDGE